MSDSLPTCSFCNAPVTVDVQGVWVDHEAKTSCSMSPTGFHHPEGTQAVAESTEAPLDIATLNMPPDTVMFVIARWHGTYYSSISRLLPTGPMHKLEAAAMLHQIAAGWENEVTQGIAQAN